MASDSAPSESELDRFRSLFQARYQPVAAYLARRLGPGADPGTVDDAVADVFLVAWRRWSQVSALDDPLPWLYGVAANVIRNHRRSTDRNLRLVAKVGHTTSGERPPDDPVGDWVTWRDGSLAAAFARLSEDDREILRLTAWEGLDRHQAAAVLDCSPDAAAQRLSRARRRLADALDETSVPAR